MPELPLDVMLEIFSRVPAKSVGRFLTLSKLFADLLSQPSFKKKHLSHGVVKLVVHKAEHQNSCDSTSWLHSMSHHPLDNYLNSDAILEISEVNYVYKEIAETTDPTQVLLVGSCNGLFCIMNKNTRVITLWNPTTRKFDCLARVPETIKSTSHISTFSFGYDELNDDYKVVCIICKMRKDETPLSETPLSNTTYIFSHRKGSWKEIEQAFPPYFIQKSSTGKFQFVHGKIHWVAYTSRVNGRKLSHFIASLDLGTERHGTVSLPPSDHPANDPNVCVLGGRLCFFINSKPRYDRGFEVWIMREYGVEQSWFLLLTIPLHRLTYFENHFKYCVPLFIMKSGEILLKVLQECKQGIYLYNPKTWNLVQVNAVYNGCLSGHIVVESLVETRTSNNGQNILDQVQQSIESLMHFDEYLMQRLLS